MVTSNYSLGAEAAKTEEQWRGPVRSRIDLLGRARLVVYNSRIKKALSVLFLFPSTIVLDNTLLCYCIAR